MRRVSTIICSPHEPDVFAIGTTEHLKLYRYNQDIASPRAAHTSPAQSISLVSGVSDVQQMKCLTWCPRPEQPWTLATGTAAGKVVLHDCTPAGMRNDDAAPSATSTSALREFVPRFQRACHAVAWNDVNSQHIAAGLDKVRSDYGVLVWDVRQSGAAGGGGGALGGAGVGGGGSGGSGTTGGGGGGASGAMSGVTGQARPAPARSFAGVGHCAADFSSCVSFDLAAVGAVDSVDEPLAQLGNSEAATCVAWLPAAPDCLLTGTGFRWLRLYDLRARETSSGSAVASCSAHAKAVVGLTFDPFNPHRVATYSEDADGIVRGWDVRRMRDSTPLFTIPAGAPAAGAPRSAVSRSKGVMHVAWCPTRRGVMSTIVDNSSTLCLWDVDKGGVAEPLPAGTAVLGAAGSLIPQAAVGATPARVARAAAAAGAAATPSANAPSGEEPVVTAAIRCEGTYDVDGVPSTAVWHPGRHSCLLLLLRSQAGDISLRHMWLHQAPPIAWSPLGSLVCARQTELLALSSSDPTPVALLAPSASAEASAESTPETPAAGVAADEVRHSPRAATLPRPPDAAAVEAAAAAADDVPIAGADGAAGAGVAPLGVASGGTLVWQRVAFDGRCPPADAEPADVSSYSGDVLLSMRWRARHAYGLEAAANVALLQTPIACASAADGRQLREAWRWLARASSEAEGMRALDARALELGLEGACASLMQDTSTHTQSSSGLGAYTSPARVRVLCSCGWEVCTDPTHLEAAIAAREAAGEFERAALMALFQVSAMQRM